MKYEAYDTSHWEVNADVPKDKIPLGHEVVLIGSQVTMTAEDFSHISSIPSMRNDVNEKLIELIREEIGGGRMILGTLEIVIPNVVDDLRNEYRVIARCQAAMPKKGVDNLVAKGITLEPIKMTA